MIDIVEPTVVGTVSPGRVHYVANIGLPPGIQIPGDYSIEFEVWSDGERLVMDLRDFERLLEVEPVSVSERLSRASSSSTGPP